MKRPRIDLHELPLLGAIFLDLAGFGMAFPDIQLRAEKFAKSEGIAEPGFVIGLILASYFLTQLLFSPIWGRFSDRIGRKPVLLVCTALSALSMFCYAIAGGLLGVLASRVLAGLAAANVVVAQAYIADTSTEENRTSRQGRVSSAILIGLVAGPAIGGYLAHFGGNRLLGLTAGTLSSFSFLWIAFSVPNRPPTAERRPGKRPVIDLSLLKELPDLRGILILATAGWFVLACLEGTFGRLIEHNLGMGQEEFGWIFSYESLLGAAMGFAIAWISSRVKNGPILKGSYFLQALGLGLTPLAPSLLGLFGASTLYAAGTGFANPTINSICSSLTPPQRQGELFGLMQGTRSIGFLIGPVIGGVLFDWHPSFPYFFAAAVALLVGLLVRIPKGSEGGSAEQP